MFRTTSRSRLAAGAVLLVLSLAACSKSGTEAGSTGTTTKQGGGPAGTTGGTAKKGNACGEWPANTSGQPSAMKKADQAGYFIWQDTGGWHLRTRGSAATPVKVSGTITGSQDLTSVKPNPADAGTVELKGNVITFDINATNDVKGFDFVAGCKPDQLQFSLSIAGNPAPADRIFVGPSNKALGSTFVISRAK